MLSETQEGAAQDDFDRALAAEMDAPPTRADPPFLAEPVAAPMEEGSTIPGATQMRGSPAAATPLPSPTELFEAPPTPGVAAAFMDHLERLVQLQQAGLLDPDEFRTAKQRLLQLGGA